MERVGAEGVGERLNSVGRSLQDAANIYTPTNAPQPITLKSAAKKLSTVKQMVNYIDKKTNTTRKKQQVSVKPFQGGLNGEPNNTDTAQSNSLLQSVFDIDYLIKDQDHRYLPFKQFLDEIDNSNASSTIGTLEFIDQIAKFNTVKNICYVRDNPMLLDNEIDYKQLIEVTEFKNPEIEK